MANKSVEAFRRLTVDMQREVFNNAVAELDAQAAALVATMKSVVARGTTGKLADTIRQKQGRKETVRVVMAGGFETTVPGGSGKPYDYARAVEFGTERGVSAQPFFFPTYRLMRNQMKSAMRRRISKTIKQYSAG